MDFYMVRRLFLIGALLPATAMADNAGALTADLMKKIDSQCSDYAEILTEARWGMALKATKSKGSKCPAATVMLYSSFKSGSVRSFNRFRC